MIETKNCDGLEQRLSVARKLLRLQSPGMFLEDASELTNFNINLLYGYVRSFVSLAYRGDIALTAKELGQTRQSIKRHILELENMLEVSLFAHIGASSSLSATGVLWLPRAQEFFELASVFMSRRGLHRAEYQSTQLPLRMLINDESNSALLRRFADAWMTGKKALNCPLFADLKDNCIIYERRNGRWASRSIGKQSAFCKWFGEDITAESEGKEVADMETGPELRNEVSFLLDAVYTRGGMHFSEVSCKLQPPNSPTRQPILYQRLMAEYIDELERPVVASVIEFINPQTDPMHD